jgi:ribosome maturation factor RimP
MSTRQLRLDSITKITTRFQEFKGKKINIVLNDKTVILAKVLEMSQTALKVLNMRLKEVKIPLDNINEIYYDTKE